MAAAHSASTPSAAFFDVDGTLTRTTIVHYYIHFRRRTMPPLAYRLWKQAYYLKCLHYLVLDRMDRGRLNTVFYRSYAGLDVKRIKALALDCHHEVILPRLFRESEGGVAAHRAAGRRVVLVTGSVDFIVQPLAQQLQVDDLIAARLEEADGRFTGRLETAPISDEEKASRIRQYSSDHDIDLSQSFAYGDSISDLPMLEAVGHPQAVNPDKALAALAAGRGWPIHRWTLPSRDAGDSP